MGAFACINNGPPQDTIARPCPKLNPVFSMSCSCLSIG